MVSSLSFLQAVASAYLTRYDDIRDVCFLFPNRRSCTFFLKALTDMMEGGALVAPQTLSITDFMVSLSEREAVSRIDAIFRLYNVYREIIGNGPDLKSDEGIVDFDRFAPWAETVLADFSEVDQYDVDANAVFNNVRDFNSIASNFLTPEQIEVMEKYFGYRPQLGDLEGFWKTLLPEEDRTELQQKFMELWKLLPELYAGLRENLERDGLALPGTAFRLAMERVLEHGREDLPWKKVVVVGFNMLSTTEVKLFKEFRELKDDAGEPYADFFWDATGPVLHPEAGAGSVAATEIRRNIRNFPMPQWAHPFMDKCENDKMPPKITIAAAPSNVAQVKVAMKQVEDWIKDEGVEKVEDAGTAIVVPDENLLLPLIHSLPESLGKVNLTMGFSMRYTAVASLVHNLRRMQTRRRKAGEEYGYHYEDLRIFTSHPLVQIVVGTALIGKMNRNIAESRLRIVPQSKIAEYSKPLAALLHPLDRSYTAEQTIDWLTELLLTVDRCLEGKEKEIKSVNVRIERLQISHYLQAMAQLLDSVGANRIEMRPLGVLRLVDRLVSGETVRFEGKPLEGLQVMGLLETRALDFERLIILSMNDRHMPRHSRKRTYIPEALRRGHGLPSSTQGEELAAYYFYRLLSRAGEVMLIYDGRPGEGMRSGGKSRFLLQLEMLYAIGGVENITYAYGLKSHSIEAKPVEKTPEVMARLERFKDKSSNQNLSASALMNYCACQVKFYLKNLMGVNDDTTPEGYIDSLTMGNIVHEAMLNLYFPQKEMREKYLEKRIVLTADHLQTLYEDEERIRRELVRAVNKKHYKLGAEERDRPVGPSVSMILPQFERMIRNIIANDIKNAPIELVGGEIKDRARCKFGTAPELNFKYAFDRVDYANGHLRILDYKTGNTNVKATEEEKVFDGTYEAHYIIQLLLYAHLLEERLSAKQAGNCEEIEMMLIDANESGRDVEKRPIIKPKEVKSYSEVREFFCEGMERLLNEMFDPEVPFMPSKDGTACELCRLHYLCGKDL